MHKAKYFFKGLIQHVHTQINRMGFLGLFRDNLGLGGALKSVFSFQYSKLLQPGLGHFQGWDNPGFFLQILRVQELFQRFLMLVPRC